MSVLLLLFLTVASYAVEVSRLHDLHIFRRSLTISGFSSGAALASQIHVSHSSIFKGVGIFAGVFYRCSGDSGNKTFCFSGATDVSSGIEDAIKYELKKMIDPLKNLEQQKVFMWLGTKDERQVVTKTRLQVVDFYQRFIPDPHNIFTKLQAAYHFVPTPYVKRSCMDLKSNEPAEKFLGNCNYSASFEMLNFLLDERIQQPSKNIRLQKLKVFNQSEFFEGRTKSETSMDDVGFYYVPKGCIYGRRKCHLHVFLHGCTLSRESVGSNFIVNSGFLHTAEENNVVMIFPQACATPKNPQGCWDTEGFTGINYANKFGTQISIVRNMLDRVLGEDDDNFISGASKKNYPFSTYMLGLFIYLLVYLHSTEGEPIK